MNLKQFSRIYLVKMPLKKGAFSVKMKVKASFQKEISVRGLVVSKFSKTIILI